MSCNENTVIWERLYEEAEGNVNLSIWVGIFQQKGMIEEAIELMNSLKDVKWGV